MRRRQHHPRRAASARSRPDCWSSMCRRRRRGTVVDARAGAARPRGVHGARRLPFLARQSAERALLRRPERQLVLAGQRELRAAGRCSATSTSSASATRTSSARGCVNEATFSYLTSTIRRRRAHADRAAGSGRQRRRRQRRPRHELFGVRLDQPGLSGRQRAGLLRAGSSRTR